MNLTRQELFAIERLCKKFKGLGGKLEIQFDAGKIKNFKVLDHDINPASLGISYEDGTLDNPRKTKTVDVME